uniref:Uncharacterized protein n=1 Tax=Sinocyclocheilus rhinocerous TaxID=307959 RepID=A0A673FNC1_9TELE
MNVNTQNVELLFALQYVLSILKFTFPTIFQGWQTSTGALLLLVTWKLGWVEINGFSRSAAFSQLPGSFLFIGNIYAGSKALSLLPIPFFFVLQNVSEVFAFLIGTATHREVSLIIVAILWEQTKIYFLHVSFSFLYVFSRIRNHKTARFYSILILFQIS